MKRIAIQGERGSFHDIAAHTSFKDEQVELMCCATFEEVFEKVADDSTAIVMLAIENTTLALFTSVNERRSSAFCG